MAIWIIFGWVSLKEGTFPAKAMTRNYWIIRNYEIANDWSATRARSRNSATTVLRIENGKINTICLNCCARHSLSVYLFGALMALGFLPGVPVFAIRRCIFRWWKTANLGLECGWRKEMKQMGEGQGTKRKNVSPAICN